MPADETLLPRFLLEHCLAAALEHPDRAWWAQLWLILDHSGQAVGSLAFKSFEETTGTAELGYGVAEPHRGRGLATEAVRRLLNETWTRPEARTIVAQIQPNNTASLRVVEKCGFVAVGEGFDAEDGRVLRYEKKRPEIFPR